MCCSKPVEFIWHQSQDLAGSDAIILPGGFAYGDYLRTGAIARFSPVMKSVEKFAKSGGMVFGICNGFQILLEAGLLPGAVMRNSGLRYICRTCNVRIEQTDTPFTNAAKKGEIMRIPIAHNDGNFNVDDATLAELEKNRQVIFRYTNAGWFGRCRGKSERLDGQHRGDLQSRAQRRRTDAASRACRRSGARLGGRVGDLSVDDRGACRRREERRRESSGHAHRPKSKSLLKLRRNTA